MKSLFYLLRKAKLAWMSAFFCFFGATSSTKSRQGNSRVLFFLFVNVKPLFLGNGQNRVHPEARWPKPGTLFHASPRAPSYWPTPAQTRLWPDFKRVPPFWLLTPPSATRFQSHLPDYGRAICTLFIFLRAKKKRQVKSYIIVAPPQHDTLNCFLNVDSF